jgi:hypothetical protein
MLHAHRVSGVLGGRSAPLVRGAIGHVGLAQLYARLWAVQHGYDVECFAEPGIAMGVVARGFGALGEEMLAVVLPLVRDYATRYSAEPFRVVEVEKEHRTQLGAGLPGAPPEGYLYTARLDLVAEDASGQVWIYDHKIVSKLEAKTFDRYSLSGQFLGQRLLGREAWGDRFGGIRLNLLAVGGRFARADVPRAPWMEAHFPEVVVAAEKRIAEVDRGLASGRFPGAAPTEVTCMTPYGACDALDFCRWGPAVVEVEE